ncbi:SulP family inorganic anion transporter [Thermithiobacillus plumbiphilus]|uniref:SulP family inorganic anion transporter n=1 Tax=Thermithiobacillus plumbiphilus TaxID=1729899 RepID=A0ABU9DCU4_9PROT
MKVLQTAFPFLAWLPQMRSSLRVDLVAGITVALILVPQSMAYAQLAGLPVVYGLYASFVPVIVGALWGSCPQLHTGPVAMLSLLSAAAVIPLAAPGSVTYIEISILLALMVGILRLGLGLARLGLLVNFVSSPVMVGFTNAAALIIGLSLLNQIIGVPMPRSDFYLADLWGVISQLPQTHLPTLAFAAGTWALIWWLGRVAPRLPVLLIAVVLATAVSAFIGFERRVEVPSTAIMDRQAAALIEGYRQTAAKIDALNAAAAAKGAELTALLKAGDELRDPMHAMRVENEIELLRAQAKLLRGDNDQRRVRLHAIPLERVDAGGVMRFHRAGSLPEGAPKLGRNWHFDGVKQGGIVLSAGGVVVGDIPQGLPTFDAPKIHWDVLLPLLPSALVMALIGLMEAVSISKAIAAKTRQRVDINKEIIGQGLANTVGSFFGAYAVSGSFSRSAVAARAGARTGFYAIISAMAVVLVLLFFTPLLHHLPQAVLAVIVMMAVFGLIRVKPLIHAWRVDRSGAVIGIATFVATLFMAPSIANGILLGVLLTAVAFLFKTMKPRAEILGRREDGVLAGLDTHGLEPLSERVVPIRFDGSLVFANVAYFDDIVLEARARFPKADTLLIVGSGINHIDATGEEKIREVAQILRESGVTLAFSGLKKQVRVAFQAGGLEELLGKENLYDSKDQALRVLLARADREASVADGGLPAVGQPVSSAGCRRLV